MSGKMNWDRVRKETLSCSHGSDWIAPSETVLGSLRERRFSKAKNRKRKKTRKENVQSTRNLAIRLRGSKGPQQAVKHLKGLIAETESTWQISRHAFEITPWAIEVFRGNTRLLGRAARRAIQESFRGCM